MACYQAHLFPRLPTATNLPPGLICLPVSPAPTLCSRTASPAPRTWRQSRCISQGLAQEGIGVLRFDFTGLGHSDGEFASTNFSSNVGDLLAATDYMRRELRAPAILIGHSLGGAAVLAAAAAIPEVKAVAHHRCTLRCRPCTASVRRVPRRRPPEG